MSASRGKRRKKDCAGLSAACMEAAESRVDAVVLIGEANKEYVPRMYLPALARVGRQECSLWVYTRKKANILCASASAASLLQRASSAGDEERLS